MRGGKVDEKAMQDLVVMRAKEKQARVLGAAPQNEAEDSVGALPGGGLPGGDVPGGNGGMGGRGGGGRGGGRGGRGRGGRGGGSGVPSVLGGLGKEDEGDNPFVRPFSKVDKDSTEESLLKHSAHEGSENAKLKGEHDIEVRRY